MLTRARTREEADRMSKMVRRNEKEVPQPKKPAPAPKPPASGGTDGWRFDDWAAL